MKVTLALLLTASVFVLSGIGCGDDDDLRGLRTGPPSSDGGSISLAGYFTDLDDIFADADAANDDAQAVLDAIPGDASLQDQVIALDEFLSRQAFIFNDAVERLAFLDVPDEAAADHADFVAAVESAGVLAADLQDQLPAIDTEEEFQDIAIAFQTDVSPILSQADEACFNLQSIADSNGVEVDLDCDA